MEVNHETSDNVKKVINKEMSLRFVINIIGIFIFVGLLLSIPITHMSEKKINIMEFLLFILASSIIYFFFVYLYFKGNLWRKLFYFSMMALAVFSICMAVYLHIIKDNDIGEISEKVLRNEQIYFKV